MVSNENKATTAKKRKVRRLKLGKALFVLPNLFTLSSVACGFYAISLLAKTAVPTAETFTVCAWAIFLAAFFDMFDGRIARMTKTQSAFGGEMDSLADVISFGVAPALTVYRWGLEELGYWGIFAAFVYVACGAIRLARFNVMAQNHVGSMNYFVGMPIPGGATMVVAMIIFQQSYLGHPIQNQAYVAALVIAIGLLMVSNVRYRTFKNLHPSPRVGLALLVLVVVTVALAVSKGVAVAAFTLVSGYFAMGILEEVIFFRSRHQERVAARQAAEESAINKEAPAEADNKESVSESND